MTTRLSEATAPRAEDQIGYLLVRLAHTLSQRWGRDLTAHGSRWGELLTGLEGRGLVRRNPAAGRGHPARVEVTAEGRRLLADVAPITSAHNEPAALGLTDDQADQLRRLLRQVLGAAG